MGLCLIKPDNSNRYQWVVDIVVGTPSVLSTAEAIINTDVTVSNPWIDRFSQLARMKGYAAFFRVVVFHYMNASSSSSGYIFLSFILSWP